MMIAILFLLMMDVRCRYYVSKASIYLVSDRKILERKAYVLYF